MGDKLLQDKLLKDLINYHKYGLEYALKEIRKEKIEFDNGSFIEPMPSENVIRGNGVWAVPIDCPDYIKLDSKFFDDRIEFRAINTITGKEFIAPFYFKEDESSAMMSLKHLHIIKNLIKKAQ
jgi:hypothetical protein